VIQSVPVADTILSFDVIGNNTLSPNSFLVNFFDRSQIVRRILVMIVCLTLDVAGVPIPALVSLIGTLLVEISPKIPVPILNLMKRQQKKEVLIR
jgi:hypothetical protein